MHKMHVVTHLIGKLVYTVTVNMQHTFNHLTDLIHYTVMTVIVNENITLQGVIATQKHQLRQQPVAHSCPVWPHEQPTVTTDKTVSQ